MPWKENRTMDLRVQLIQEYRQMPRRVPELEYGDDVLLRRISQQGSLKMNGGAHLCQRDFRSRADRITRSR
jgi:hypothetical protein